MNTGRPAPIVYRYPPARLIPDYLRAGLGGAFCLAILSAAAPGPFAAWIFGLLAAVFILFALHIAQLQLTRVQLDDQGISMRKLFTRRLQWEQLEGMRLRYFASRRQRRQGSGAIQLTLRARKEKMTLDGQIEGFRDILWHALREAQRRGLTLDPITSDNLLAIDLDPERDQPRPPP